jgi:hypothetical protein
MFCFLVPEILMPALADVEIVIIGGGARGRRSKRRGLNG